MNKSIQLCIVSDQSLANIIPILQFRPVAVALAISAEMQRKNVGRIIRNILKAEGIEEISLPEIPSDFKSLQEYCLNTVTGLKDKYPGSPLIYNATGGTKLMVLSFVTQYAGEFDEVIYTDTEHHKILSIKKDMSAVEQPMRSVLDITGYLKAQGKTVRKIESDTPGFQENVYSRKEATEFLARHADKFDSFLGELNKLIGDATEKKVRSDEYSIIAALQQFNQPISGLRKEAIQLLVKHNLLQWAPDKPGSIYLHNPNAIGYLKGAWLEEYAYLCGMKSGAEHVALSVSFTDDFAPKENIRNELDVVVLHNNVCLIIECKTGNFRKDVDKAHDVIYQMDSLKRGAGSFAKSVLLSARPLDHETREGRKVAVESRARSSQIEPIVGSALKDLTQHIKSALSIE
jgi:hypothetical protein